MEKNINYRLEDFVSKWSVYYDLDLKQENIPQDDGFKKSYFLQEELAKQYGKRK